MPQVLVINSGSSSFKYQLIDPEQGTVFAQGLVEKIGTEGGFATHEVAGQKHTRELAIPDYRYGFALMMESFVAHGPELVVEELSAVGHRVVQGGSRYSGPVVLDDRVLQDIDELSALAPLHNPPALVCSQEAMKIFPHTPHVAVFDTAFHQTMPVKHYSYAIHPELAEKHRIRKYGFHGTSHAYVARRAVEILGLEPNAHSLITLHLGNGASVTAVRNGESINTSMGMTPLEGLVMGTRSGDIDPGVLFHLHRTAQYSIDDLDLMLNRNSGLFGMTGSGDMRDVQQRAKNGEPEAQLGLDIYYERVKHYIGGYYAQLGPLDALVFTAGVGENSVETREGVLRGLEALGIELDPERNAERSSMPRRISTDTSRVAVLVIPTNEELEIAQQAHALVTDPS